MVSRVKTPAAITVRPLEIDDLPRVQDIDHKSTGRYRARTYEDPLSACLGGDLAISYVAERNGEVVGFVFGWLVDAIWAFHEGARMEMIGVDPACRRQGAGRQLLDAFLHGCHERGVREIHVLVHSSDRELKAFLGKSNFQRGQLLEYERHIGATTA